MAKKAPYPVRKAHAFVSDRCVSATEETTKANLLIVKVFMVRLKLNFRLDECGELTAKTVTC